MMKYQMIKFFKEIFFVWCIVDKNLTDKKGHLVIVKDVSVVLDPKQITNHKGIVFWKKDLLHIKDDSRWQKNFADLYGKADLQFLTVDGFQCIK